MSFIRATALASRASALAAVAGLGAVFAISDPSSAGTLKEKVPLSVETVGELETHAYRRKSKRARARSPEVSSPVQATKEKETGAAATDPPPTKAVNQGEAEAPSPPGKNNGARNAATAPPVAPTPASPSAKAPDGLPVTGIDQRPAEWSNEEVIAGLRQCLSLLSPLGVEILPADPIRSGACGDAAPVRLKSAGKNEKVVFDPPVEVNCKMAAQLAGWIDTSLQPTARALLSSPVTKIRGASGYSCRNRYGQADAPLSEHATGNAVDIPNFILADGRSIRVEGAWGPTARDLLPKPAVAAVPETGATATPKASPQPGPPPGKQAPSNNQTYGKAAPSLNLPPREGLSAAHKKQGAKASEAEKVRVANAMKGVPLQKLGAGSNIPVMPAVPKDKEAVPAVATAETRFLRRLAKEACATFGTVLGPEANDAHRDHFHFDIKARRKKAFCQ